MTTNEDMAKQGKSPLLLQFKKWKDFRVDKNNTELFHFLSQVVCLPIGEGRVIYATDGRSIGGGKVIYATDGRSIGEEKVIYATDGRSIGGGKVIYATDGRSIGGGKVIYATDGRSIGGGKVIYATDVLTSREHQDLESFFL